MKYDIIIIGAGLGGLTAGAKLAKEGKKVLLVEQHFKPGGCATTFKRKDFVLEVGLHEMDGLDRRDMKTKIFRDLGVFNKVEFLKVPEFYHFTNGRSAITMPHEPEKAIKELCKYFPEEQDGINRYFDQILNARQKAKESAGQKEKSVGEFLDSVITNEDLKLCLLGNLGYFHDDPYSISLNYYSVAQGSYYSGGGNFVKGGSQMLSNCLSDIITENRGEVILRHMVTEILTENNKATGIVYKRKGDENALPVKAFANEIIANAAIPNVAKNLLPEEYGNKLKQEITNHKTGASLLTVYFGFKKPVKELGNKYYSTFIYDESVETQKDILMNNKSDFTERSFTFIDDVVDAFLLATNNERLFGNVYNLGANHNYSLLDFVNYLKQLCTFDFSAIPFPPEHKAIDIGDYFRPAYYGSMCSYCKASGLFLL